MGRAATVSYIVAVFNAEATLRHCLNSLINQTYKEIEILLINDGSTDNSADICEEYARKDPRIRVLHQSNKGVSYTRQRGLDEARGKYVIHADPDDWVESDTLSQMVAYAEEHQTDILISDFWFNGPGQCDLKNHLVPPRALSSEISSLTYMEAAGIN